MVEVWNRECERVEKPERKMKGAPARAEQDGNDGPF